MVDPTLAISICCCVSICCCCRIAISCSSDSVNSTRGFPTYTHTHTKCKISFANKQAELYLFKQNKNYILFFNKIFPIK